MEKKYIHRDTGVIYEFVSEMELNVTLFNKRTEKYDIVSKDDMVSSFIELR